MVKKSIVTLRDDEWAQRLALPKKDQVPVRKLIRAHIRPANA